MKRKILFSLSLFMFAALMAFNLQQVDKELPDGLSSISLETLDIMPVTAQAEGGGNGECSSGYYSIEYWVTCSDGSLSMALNEDYWYCIEGNFGGCNEGRTAAAWTCDNQLIFYLDESEYKECILI